MIRRLIHCKLILPFLSVFILAACGGGGGSGGGSVGQVDGTNAANSAPTILGAYSNTQVACCYFEPNNDYFSMEGITSIFTVSASDAEGDSITFSLSGDDASKINISKKDGVNEAVVSFILAPNFESPEDANSDNIYSFNVIVSDGTLSSSQAFTISVTKDTSADTASAWDGVLLKNDAYKPYDKYGTSYNLIVGALPDVTDGFATNVLNIANKILASNDATNSVNRDLLLNNFNQYNAFQRVGKTNMSSYDPALNNDNYAGWDFINDNYAVVDFIWESTYSSPADERTKANQINAILEHLLHTITLIFDKSYTSWGYEDESSELVLAMNEAITGGFYNPSDNYGSLSDSDPALYKRIIAQEFAYWMIVTGWDLKSLYAPDVATEWTILTATEMETKLPLAHKLFTDTVNGVLVNPTQAYLDGLTFSSLPTANAAPPTPNSSAVTIAVSVAANNAGSGNVYVIEGTQKKSLTLEAGKTYTFSHPTAHPLRFSTFSDGTHSTVGGYPSQELREYTDGVNTSTAGSTVIEARLNSSHAHHGTTLYYYCSLHSGMGGSITISD